MATYKDIVIPHGLAATPDGEYLVAGSLNESPLPDGAAPDTPNSKLYLIHPGHGHVMLTIPVSGWSYHQAIIPDGRYVLSTHPTRGYVSVADLQTNKVIRTVATGPGPEHAVFSLDERTIDVANPQAATVSVVDVSSGKVVKTLPVGMGAHGIGLSDNGRTLYVSSRGESKLDGIDMNGGKKRSLALRPAPYHLDTIPGAGVVYVLSSQELKIWIVDQKTLTLKETIVLPGGEAHQMAIVP